MKRLFIYMSLAGILASVVACRKDKTFNSTVTAGAQPTVSVSYTPSDTSALAIQFNNNSQNATTYYWQFGDGTTSTTAAPQHTYTTSGRYTVKVVAKSDAGYSADTSILVIAAARAVAKFTTTASGVYLTFNNASISIDSCSWNFGDNSATSNAISPSHLFSEAGNYPVTLTVYGIGGDTAVITTSVTVGYECINGGGMESGDAASWTVWSQQANDPPTFGYTTDHPSAGSGGCLEFPNFVAPGGGSTNELLYQQVYVQAGKQYQFSAQVKLPAGGTQCYMQFYLSTDPNTWNENNGNPPTQLFASLNTWHGWGGYSGSGPTVAVDGSLITLCQSLGLYGPYASNGIYTATTTGWMYLGIQAGTWEGYSNGAFLVDDVSFAQLP
jgi:PKD repeat protein